MHYIPLTLKKKEYFNDGKSIALQNYLDHDLFDDEGAWLLVATVHAKSEKMGNHFANQPSLTIFNESLR